MSPIGQSKVAEEIRDDLSAPISVLALRYDLDLTNHYEQTLLSLVYAGVTLLNTADRLIRNDVYTNIPLSRVIYDRESTEKAIKYARSEIGESGFQELNKAEAYLHLADIYQSLLSEVGKVQDGEQRRFAYRLYKEAGRAIEVATRALWDYVDLFDEGDPKANGLYEIVMKLDKLAAHEKKNFNNSYDSGLNAEKFFHDLAEKRPAEGDVQNIHIDALVTERVRTIAKVQKMMSGGASK